MTVSSFFFKEGLNAPVNEGRLQRTDLTINTLLNVNMLPVGTATVTVELQSGERLDKTKPKRRNLYGNLLWTM